MVRRKADVANFGRWRRLGGRAGGAGVLAIFFFPFLFLSFPFFSCLSARLERGRNLESQEAGSLVNKNKNKARLPDLDGWLVELNGRLRGQ